MNRNTASERLVLYVLVVDTGLSERFTMSMLLQRFGCTVCSASSAKEAIEFLCVAPAVAVFAEAGTVGLDLQARLGADARFRDVPLILVAESPDRDLEKRVQRGEFAGLLRKPFNADEVFATIQRVIEKGTRRNIRITTSFPALLSDTAGAAEGHVTVLSQYGLFFRTLEPRPVNARVAVEFSVWERPISLEATVLYASSFEDGPFLEPGMGLKFVKIGPEDSSLIRAYILEHIGRGITDLDGGPAYRSGYA
jgi:CheY-like chemotaxis protein